MLILLQLSIPTESQTLFTKVLFQFQDPILKLKMHFVVISTQSPLSNYFFIFIIYCSVQFSSFAQSCPTLCDPMNHSTPGLPVHHQLPEFTQTHVHQIDDAIQPSHPLSIPFSSCLQSFPASGSFHMSQLFASGGQSIGVSASISVLPMNTQDWSPLGWTGWTFLPSKGHSRVFSNTTFKSINSSALSFLYSPTLTSILEFYTIL